MIFLEIKNWTNFQHYKNRNPPWIKLHYELITSHDWVMWDDASKMLAVVCMMLASRNEGKVPADESYIQKVAHLQKKPNLKPLINSGFFVDASKMLALDASTKTETYSKEKDKEKNTKKEIILPDWIPIDLWESWLEVRKRGTNIPGSLNMAIAKLERWKNSGYDISEILRTSVIGGYQGIFEPSVIKKKPPNLNYSNPIKRNVEQA